MAITTFDGRRAPRGRRPAIDRGLAIDHRLVAMQLTAAAVDGLVLSSTVVHAVEHLGLRPTTVGAVLAAAALIALVTAPAAGALIDRFGLSRTLAVCFTVTAIAVVGYARAGSAVTFAVAAVLFVSAQAIGGSARQALAVVATADAARARVRAAMHTVLNTGLGLGAVLGAVVIASGSQTAFLLAYVVGAAAALVAGVAALQGPRRQVASSPLRPSGGMLIALRDRRFVLATAAACVVQLTMPILSVLVPVLVVHVHAAGWIAAAALAVNTVLVIVMQRPWTARLVDARSTARSAAVAAFALVVAGALLAAAEVSRPAGGIAVFVLTATVALTVGEVGGGAAVWTVALSGVPGHAEGRYQAAFSMSSSGARILGPLVALPLVLTVEPAGWLILTTVMAAACLLIAKLALASRRGVATVPEPVL